jgi:hypothetical protein
MALHLPVHPWDNGTSRWQLRIERYTKFPRVKKGRVIDSCWPIAEIAVEVE